MEKNDLSLYNINPSLLKVLNDLLGKNKVKSFLDACYQERPLYIRFNKTKISTLKEIKTIEKLIHLLEEKKKFEFEECSQLPYTFMVKSSIYPIGATNEYQLGLYSVQDKSSAIPVLALDPKPGEFVIDACAAPGGKSTYIADLMEGKGTLICNDLDRNRSQSLLANLSRCGVKNAIVTNLDATGLNLHFTKVGKILLDAPCTGIGLIGKDKEVGIRRDKKSIKERSELQKKMILSAIDALRINGILVYSTCSISIEENEDVINYALMKRRVKIREIPYEDGDSGVVRNKGKIFSETLRKCKRFYPHKNNTNGFFVAKLEKIEEMKKKK